ncbi:carbohydrate ABC transporter permease [Paenibacillus sp. IHBB 10380]|uniref:carbohydrate ABC transporter permease n=1 Tax=Paenibacillus sp. IHBB 10380 TaxID=1566358 RepID=UPI0005CFED9B|nr:sugar ABC transporter permease [Paenibacillus sp. IHBB 10380]AJS58219.1 spermidine/putrescine ABC transporter permease [Paenibacillus sp. IHBB 10380]
MIQSAKPIKKLSLLKRRRKGIKGDEAWGYAFIAVALVVFAMFTAYPVVSAFIISFQQYKPLGATFIGFENYINALTDSLFWKSIKNTIVYTVLTVPVALLISFSVAILILPLKKWLQTTFKAVYYLPAVASGVSLSVVWLWMYDPMSTGIFNKLIGLFGIQNQNWLGSSSTSMLSLVIMAWLSSHGTSIIIYIAGLLGIDDSYYEAAELDGASFLQKLWYIVIPCLKPTTLFLLVTGVIGSFQVFQNAYLMTGGGPDNSTTMVGLLIFNNAFKYFEFGKAAAQSLILALIIAGISLFQFKFLGNDVEY